MHLLLDFLPVIAFFVTYKMFANDIYLATQVIIVAAPVIVGVTWLMTRRLRPMQALSAGLVVVFGGITLAVHDTAFIMWKPTVLNWLFAAAFLASHLPAFGGRPLVRRFMESEPGSLELPTELWRQLNLVWAAFFAAMGLLNLYVFKTYPESIWVTFKLWGMLGLTLAFAVGQGVWLASRARAADGDTG
jgi:intracellular septation protein